MKQAFFTYMLLLCLNALHAQQPMGNAVIGGTFNYQRRVSDFNDSQTGPSIKNRFQQYSINPYIGFWFGDAWMAGLQGGVSFTKRTQFVPSINEFVENKQNEASIGLFLRRYLGGDRPLRFFLEPGIIYSISDNKYSNSQVSFGPTQSYKQTRVYLSPGVSWAVTKRFNLLGRFGRMNYVTGKREPYDGAAKIPYHYFDMRMNGSTFFIGAELRL